MKKVIKTLLPILMLVSMFLVLSVNTFAEGCKWEDETDANGNTKPGVYSEFKTYYDQYNVNFNYSEMTSIDKYTTQPIPSEYKYAITYVTRSGDICNVLTKTIPDDFGLWNTNITVLDGRVVVTGVNGDDTSSWNLIFAKYRWFIVGCSGLAAMSCVLAFVLFFIKMGANSGNPGERAKTLSMLLFTGAGAAGLGAVTIIFGFFWNLL